MTAWNMIGHIALRISTTDGPTRRSAGISTILILNASVTRLTITVSRTRFLYLN